MMVAALIALVLEVPDPLNGVVKSGFGAFGAAMHAYVRNLPLGFLQFASMLGLLVVGHRWVPTSGRAHKLGLALLVLALASAGTLAFQATLGLRYGWPAAKGEGIFAYVVQFNLTNAWLLVFAYEYMFRSRAAKDGEHAAQLERLALEHELAGAQLQLLQAQVEPHFLFNTLANLRRLVRTDRGAARSMLADLMNYLEAALPRLRDERSTLARELALVQAYLAVHQVRMGARLRVSVDVPAELGTREVPPMLLLTLVENALKHGVQPLVEGALVRVAASAHQGQLTLTVADTGCGMASGSGSGSGLANLRARLKALYGNAASLTLHVNEPRGLLATIVLPEALG
jgi:signal transduction histidine kinase